MQKFLEQDTGERGSDSLAGSVTCFALWVVQKRIFRPRLPDTPTEHITPACANEQGWNQTQENTFVAAGHGQDTVKKKNPIIWELCIQRGADG